jgi:hypothetical protein
MNEEYTLDDFSTTTNPKWVPMDIGNLTKSSRADQESVHWSWDLVADADVAWSRFCEENERLSSGVVIDDMFWSFEEATTLASICALESWERAGIAFYL